MRAAHADETIQRTSQVGVNRLSIFISDHGLRGLVPWTGHYDSLFRLRRLELESCFYFLLFRFIVAREAPEQHLISFCLISGVPHFITTELRSSPCETNGRQISPSLRI